MTGESPLAVGQMVKLRVRRVPNGKGGEREAPLSPEAGEIFSFAGMHPLEVADVTEERVGNGHAPRKMVTLRITVTRTVCEDDVEPHPEYPVTKSGWLFAWMRRAFAQNAI